MRRENTPPPRPSKAPFLGLREALKPLAALPHWLVWRYELAGDKWTKVPYQARRPQAKASSNNKATWSDYNTALAVVKSHADVDGIGFCLLGSGLAAFDLDDCRDPTTGKITAWAQNILTRAASYTEVTASSEGLRIIGYGDGSEVHCKHSIENGSVEIYRRATRYIAMTGNALNGYGLENIDKVVDEVVAELDAAKKKKKSKAKGRTKDNLPQELRIMLHLTGDQPAGYNSRSELFWAFINTALRKNVNENDIIDAALAHPGCSITNHVLDNGGEDYIKRQIERAANDSLAEGEKRIIQLRDGEMDKHWREAEAALIATHCPVFVRSGALVQPLWRMEDTGEGNRQVLAAKLVKFNVARLSDVLAHHAVTFQRWDKKEKKWRNVDPPPKLVEQLIEVGHWGLPDVAGIITAPTMRRDGSLITNPGYDAATQLWYKPASDIELSAIHDDRSAAEKALAKLKELIAECAFADQQKDGPSIDRSVALAAMMTVVLRGAFTVAPLFLIHKPEPGTGGSYLVKIISTISLGREAVPLNVSEDPKELTKELSAAAYEGKPILNLNNLSFDLKSSLLSQMITERWVDIRPFLKNTETVRCDCRAMTVLANGNNIKVVGELVRRTMSCRLDTKMEHPEEKEYTNDPLAMIQRDRGGYLAAIFTIVRAYMKSGATPKVIRINGLEEWSCFVQQPLVWLDEADPAKSQEDARARDPERHVLHDRVEAVVKHFGTRDQFTADDVCNAAMRMEYDSHGKSRLVNKDLFDAFSRDGKFMSNRSIGRQLSKDEGRVVNGHSIEIFKGGEKAHRGNVYCIVPKVAERL
jgi:hypothetical protein